MNDQPGSSSSGTAHIDIQQQEQLAMAAAALRGAAPRLYANGFILAQSASDISVIMLTNGAVTSVLSLSMISAKALAEELAKALSKFEAATGQRVPTLVEIQEKLSKGSV